MGSCKKVEGQYPIQWPKGSNFVYPSTLIIKHYQSLYFYGSLEPGIDLFSDPALEHKSTGWFIMIDKKFELYAWARIQAVSLLRWIFSIEILTFGYFASKNSKEFHVFFKFQEYFETKILKMCKIYWKIRINPMPVSFCKHLWNKRLGIY